MRRGRSSWIAYSTISRSAIACSVIVCPAIACSILACSAGFACAQDTTQQIVMQQQQQQAMQQQLLVQQQTDLINQQQLAQSTVTGLGGYQLGLRKPSLQQEPGKQPGTVVVRMKDASRGSSIFYTTDGWTPTAASRRYEGPVTLAENTTLQAIAIAPGGLRSYIVALPVVTGSAASAGVSPGQVRVRSLEAGTPLPLVMTEAVTSRGLRVGDPVPVALAESLYVDGKRVAERGAKVNAVVTQVDNSHHQGLPGVLSFTVRSLQLDGGEEVGLLGVRTMEGADRTRKANLVSIVPLAGLAVHGGDAVIPEGMRFDAHVADAVSTK